MKALNLSHPRIYKIWNDVKDTVSNLRTPRTASIGPLVSGFFPLFQIGS